ncbi:unnamed protein product [Cochlearia groenlandica]
MSQESEETKAKADSCGELSNVDNENCSSSSSSVETTKRTCVDCGTNRTPLWRGGPSGPKSLCNACGIKSRKKRQAALGMKPVEKTRKKKKNKHIDDDSSSDLSHEDKVKINKKEDDRKTCWSKSSATSSSKGVGKFLELGYKVPAMKRTTVEKKRMWRKLGEEERAAVLLMSLSFASVYA